MRSKCFTLASSFAFCLAGVSLALAQSPAPTPIPGYIRFWNMLPASNGAFDLRKIGGSSPDSAIAANATAYRYSSYVALPTGRLRVGVYRALDAKSPLRVIDVDLSPESFFTVLMSPGKIDLINDTNDSKASIGTITVRNYFPKARVAISLGTRKLVHVLAYGASYEISDLPLGRTSLGFQTELPNGSPVQGAVDVDFRESKRVTVLLIPDSYGRFRPRVTLDGKDF